MNCNINGRFSLRVFSVLLMVVCVSMQANAADKSPPEALHQYNDAVNFQNNGAFDLAVDEWNKFLKKFPKDPLADRAQHYLGVCYTQLNPPKYELASAAFEKAIAGFPKSKLRENNYLNLGWSYLTLAQGGKAESYPKAAAAFGGLVKEFPKGELAAEAHYLHGEALYGEGKRKEAVAAYAEVVNNHADSKRRVDALYALGVTQEELEDYAAAGKAYDAFLEEFPDHEFITEVKMRKAETILQGGDNQAAEKMFAEVAAAPGFAWSDHALFRQATAALRQDAYDRAAGLFAELVTDHARSSYAKGATIDAARCYFRAKDYKNALPWLNKALAAGGDEAPEAAHWLARVHLTQGKPAEAIKAAEKGLKLAAKDNAFLVNLKKDQADAIFETPKRRAEALGLYLKIVEGHPNHQLAARSLYDAAFTALELEKFDDALTHATAFLEKFAGHELELDVKHTAAEANLQLGKHADAEKLFGELVAAGAKRPELQQWQVRLGLCQFLQKKYKETVATLTAVANKVDSADLKAQALFLVGTSQFHLNDFTSAIPSLEGAIAANPKWAQADETWLNLSRAQRKLSKFDEAKKSVARVISDFPESKLLDRAHFRLGEYSYASRDYKAAIKEYDELLTNWPKSTYAPYALYGKGWGLLRQKQYDGAIAAFTALIDGHADHRMVPDAHNARAICRRQSGDLEGGIADVNAFLATSPSLDEKIDALYERGMCEAGLKKHQAAIDTFAEILKGKPDYEHADKVIYETAWAFNGLEREDDAIKAYQRLVAKHPDSKLAADSHYRIGQYEYKNKKFANAVNSYTAATKSADRDDLAEESVHKLGWANYQLEKYESALTAFAAQMKKFGDGDLADDGRFMQAECLFKLDRFEEAAPIYQALAQKEASNDEIAVLTLLHGGQSAGQLEQWAESIALLEKIPVEHEESPFVAEAYFELGQANFNLTQYDAALPLFEKATELSRDVTGARSRFMMGEVHFVQKDTESAVREFQRVLFGYGADNAPDDVKKWQAKSAYEAGRCYDVRIAKENDRAKRSAWIAKAKRFYGDVVKKYPESDEATMASSRLQELAKLK